MRFSIDTREGELKPAIYEYLKKKLNKINKHIEEGAEVHVIYNTERGRHIFEFILKEPHISLTIKKGSFNIYNSIDTGIDTLINQIKKEKQKIIEKHRRNINKKLLLKEEIKEKIKEVEIIKISYKPCNVEEALMELESDPNKIFLAFINSEGEQLNVLYKKNNGKYGLIQP